MSKDSPSEIPNNILCNALLLKKRKSYLKIIVTGIFLRDGKVSRFCIIVTQINQFFKKFYFDL